jgi:ligand-binding sensor domain-containing protein
MRNFKPFFNRIILLIILIFSVSLRAQENNSRWDDYFSYSNIKHIWEINGLIFCSAENGLFSYDPATQEIQKYSKVNDLNDVGVTAFNYNPQNQILFIGYQRGEMDILAPEENHNFLEIPLQQTYTGSKRVNHIATNQNTAIISGEFGLASFSLEDFEFMETVYFVQGGVYFGVKESAVLDGVIYAASDHGIFTHPLDEFIANFVSWEQPPGIPNSAFQNIVSFQGNIVASTGNTVYRFDGNNWASLGVFPDLRDLSVNGNVLSITQINRVSNYDDTFSMIDNVAFSEELNTGLRVAGTTYGGSKLHGLLNGLNEIYPDGPYNNNSYAVEVHQNQIWISPGAVNNFNNPLGNNDGYFHFNGDHWVHNKSEDMLYAKDILDIEVNPTDTTEVYVSSWYEYGTSENIHIGLLKMTNGQFVENYNSENSSIKFRERIAGSCFDEQGNLWVSQAFVENEGMGLSRLDTSGNWQYIFLGTDEKYSARKPVIYNGYAFVPLPRGGGLKVSDMQNVYTITSTANLGDLPTDEVISAAIDQDGVLWIGTFLGLRVLYNPIDAVTSGSFVAEPIIIEQNGIPEALLTDVQINDIEVDGANRKWVATESGGAYYFSEDGTETVFNFTSQNSPLPSNKVNDIEVDESTGIVYFATDKGLVSYRSDAVNVGDSFGDVYSYPNPVRPGFTGVVTIKGLPNEADVRIVDVVGNLIYQTKAAGGIAQWDTKNFNGKEVASGIYLVLMSNRDASETKQTKIAIIR